MRIEVDDLVKKWFVSKAAELMMTPGELLEAMYQDNESVENWLEQYAASKFENLTFWQWLYVSGHLHDVIDLHDWMQDYIADLEDNNAMDQIAVREEIACCMSSIQLYFTKYLSDSENCPDDTLEKAMKGVLDWRCRKRKLISEQLWSFGERETSEVAASEESSK